MMFHLRTFYVLLTAFDSIVFAGSFCAICWPDAIFTQPAVGLDFGPSHGRAVFKWPNGTVEEIAVIPGNPEYSTAMVETAECFAQSKTSKGHQHAVVSEEAVLSGNRSCVSTSGSEDPLLEALSLMAQQLKTRVDASLAHHSVTILGATHPVFFNSLHQMLLEDAIRTRAGFNPSLTYFQTSSAIATAAANGIKVCDSPVFVMGCIVGDYPEKEMILHVDYSDALLTILLYEGGNPGNWEDGGIVYVARSLPLELDAAQQNEFWESAKAALQIMVARYAIDSKIDQLILSGSHANNSNLHNALHGGIGPLALNWTFYVPEPDALASENASSPFRIATGRGSMMVDPVTAPARGAAHMSWGLNMRACIDPCFRWREESSLCENPENYKRRPRNSTLMDILIANT